MKTKYYFIIFFLLADCNSRKEEEVKIPLGEVGILVSSSGKVLVHDLVKEGTYTFEDSIYNVVRFPVYAETSLNSSFQTRDSMQFTAYMTVDYILDTTKIFEMYNVYREKYYDVEYEPNLKRIFRETIGKYASDSLKHEKNYNKFFDSFTREINNNLSKEYLIMTELKIDSIVERKQDSPFK